MQLFPFQLDTTHLSVESVAARVLAMTNGRTESARFLSVNIPRRRWLHSVRRAGDFRIIE